jgi:hypothetical protein
MDLSNLSEKLKTYLDKIKKETKRDIVINEVDDKNMYGMSAAHEVHPIQIHILLAKTQHSIPQMEQSIAHEATHGLLIYKEKYLVPMANNNKSVNLLATMVDDIIVNKIIYENGFNPFAYVYLNTVQEEIKALRKSRDYYKNLGDDEEFKNKFKTFRYIIAWGFVQYYDLESWQRKILKKFLKTVELSCPELLTDIRQIKDSIIRNNIFEQEGHDKALREIADIWGLKELILFKQY